MDDTFLDRLRSIVGEANVLASGDLSAYEQDWRGWWTGKALAVARPRTSQEVADVVKVCVAAGVSIVPQGGNTGLVEGGVPDASGRQLVVQMGRMQAVRQIDEANMTVTVEAGCVLASLQQQVRDAGLLFPLSLGAEGSCMVGGNLATNAGGTQVLRYGNARDLCLGLEVVTPAGDVLHSLSGLRKDNSGYDLRDLFVGSEGTLGIITAATLKVFPLPASTVTCWAAARGIEEAIGLLGLARQHLGASLTGFEFMDETGLDFVVRNMPMLRVPFADSLPPYSILIETSGPEPEPQARAVMEALLESALQQDLITDVVLAESGEQARQLWDVRENIPLAQVADGPNVKHDISLPISAIPAFVARSQETLSLSIPGVRIVNFGHLGDGNLHYNVQGPEGCKPQEFMARHGEQVTKLVYQEVAALGGSFSAEHGVGRVKADALAAYKCPTALRLMRAIKAAIDPLNVMNPRPYDEAAALKP
jgi:FAD/FMN-containing dehydrogenase